MRTIPFGRPIIGEEERAAVAEVLSGHLLTHGPFVKSFEADFARFTAAPFAVATSSCTAALHLAYAYLGIGSGEEVIVPAQTHVATAHAVEYCGAKPVFVDSEPLTGNIDIEAMESLVTGRTRALSVVHYLGMPVDMDRINAIARKHGLFVVEDCALAVGTFYRETHAGLHGDVGCFSFYPVKHLTTAEGGMLITTRGDVAEVVAKQRAFGIDRNIVSERKTPGDYDVELLGWNYRMNELSAALGLHQLARTPGFLAARRKNYEALTARLNQIEEIDLFQSSHGEFQSSYYCHSIVLNDSLAGKRRELVELLQAKGIGTSVYYPRPLPHTTYFRKKYGYSSGSFPVAARISSQSIALPVGPHVDRDDVDYMISVIKSAIAEVA